MRPRTTAIAGAIAALLGCTRPPVTAAREQPAPERASSGALQVLMISGGGSSNVNFQSHLTHLRQFAALLAEDGVGREQISVFAGDGADPAPDLALREVQPEKQFWLLEGTDIETPLKTPITFASSTLPGFTLQPATKPALARWFGEAGKRLRPGDRLLLYVTDHGTRDPKDPDNNRITLWGKDQFLSVKELGAMIEGLPAGVRVVALMSQCFSGGFAEIRGVRSRYGLPVGDFCGYFSSTADRPAYGCYPETRDRDNVGHSFVFLEALRAQGTFAAAHQSTLANDLTPDVPLRTSDVYLEERLAEAARVAEQEPSAFIDKLLAGQKDRREIERLARQFGLPAPQSLADLAAQTLHVEALSRQLKTHARAWTSGFADMSQANLARFRADRSDWDARLSVSRIVGLAEADRRTLTAAMLRELDEFVQAGDRTRILTLREKKSATAAVAFRSEVRLAGILRLRAALTSLAGRSYLASRGSPAERKAYDALVACEDLRLGGTRPARAPAGAPLPSTAEDDRLAKALTPSWMGINFKGVPAERRGGLPSGSSLVDAVTPGSPAATAGVKVGDVLLGPPGRLFTEKNEIRPWTFLSPLGKPLGLDVFRANERVHLTVTLREFPVAWPSAPAPAAPKLDTPAPPLALAGYRGKLPAALTGGGPHLLFFWATYCGPCKASLPEVLAYSRTQNVPVVAITEEPRDTVDTFFRTFKNPFPETVALDQDRKTVTAFGVSGLPTFVLVDGDGKIKTQTTGYAEMRGLGIDGWHFDGDAPPH